MWNTLVICMYVVEATGGGVDCAGFLSLILIMNFSDELDQREPAKSARFPSGE